MCVQNSVPFILLCFGIKYGHPLLLYKSIHVTFVFWVPKTPPTPYMFGTFVIAPPPPPPPPPPPGSMQYALKAYNLACFYSIYSTSNILIEYPKI